MAVYKQLTFSYTIITELIRGRLNRKPATVEVIKLRMGLMIISYLRL